MTDTREQTWARTVHTVLTTPYPYATQHVSLSADDVDVTPSRLHPAFHGSFDWHSSVHMVWSGLTLLAEGVEDPALEALLEERLTASHVAAEAAYLRQRPSFERPYGWAWAARLTATCAVTGRWADETAPLLDAVADLARAWLPTLGTPNRSGEHANLAFALTLLHSSALDVGRADLADLVEVTAHRLYVDDRDAPVAYEPGPSDFLSPSLTEAALVHRVLDVEDWLGRFLPRLGLPDDPLLTVPQVSDPTDGKGAHLIGLALSRSWQLRTLADVLPDERSARVLAAADEQEASALAAVDEGDFMATHWLVSFALLAAGGLAR
ncbi:hypothetical protein GCM10011519_07820 [Marmoricola endophyticus]|uniref:DUF2891 domain-containing protein n=1 Tax=Marmoricola endophyticus TaxID=2040280 RepID=A0A917BDA5_9ACTN|nr:DUF2891 family protein [Marmoricola endophyticus]GGF36712.1 hypothetical protein GCM10011519_07820 [Marmoricola endophyticus]